MLQLLDADPDQTALELLIDFQGRYLIRYYARHLRTLQRRPKRWRRVVVHAHEDNQPIGAARNNAHAALRFLSRDPPDLAEVEEALECVVKDTYRAGDIVARIRDQVKKRLCVRKGTT